MAGKRVERSEEKEGQQENWNKKKQDNMSL